MCISKFQKPYPLYPDQNVIGVTIACDRCRSVVSHKPDMKISKDRRKTAFGQNRYRNRTLFCSGNASAKTDDALTHEPSWKSDQEKNPAT
jgi:hypothetical protein